MKAHEFIDDANRWGSEYGYFRGEGTLNDGETPAADTNWADVLKATLPAVAGVYQQRELNKMNQALINTGRPPMTAEQFMQTQAAAGQVNVGMSADTKRIVMIAGLGLLAIIGLKAAKVI